MNAKFPDAAAVALTIKAWATANPKFAGWLATGMPAAEALTRLSLELLRANRIADAIALLRSALTLTPNDAVLWTNHGIALDRGDFSEESAASLEHALALARKQPDTWLLLGVVKKKLGDLDGAEAALRTALEQEPHSSAAWQFLGLLKQERKDFAGAVDCLLACLKSGGADAAVLANLGKLQYQLGRFPEAAEAYQRAAGLAPANSHFRQMLRRTGFVRDVLAGESIDTAIISYGHSLSPDECRSGKDLEDLLSSAFSMLSAFGHVDAAVRLAKKRLELWPDDPATTFLLKAATGDQSLNRTTLEYVVEHFNKFAEGFDAQLVGALGYDVPAKLGAAIREVAVAGQLHTTLDAGCGTGLCGPQLRPLSRELVGVDLSPKMLEHAARRNLYDALECADLMTFLNRTPGRFDLIAAADVMVYFGDLHPLFAALAEVLKPGGLLAFSIETWSGAGYRLQPSGRFAHAPPYVRSVAARVFKEKFHVETTLRTEANRPLAGNIFVFERC